MSEPNTQDAPYQTSEADHQSEQACQMPENVTRTIEAGQQFVRENPWPVIGGVFLVGMAVGAALCRHEEQSKFDQILSALSHKAHSVGDQVRSSNLAESAQRFGRSLKFW